MRTSTPDTQSRAAVSSHICRIDQGEIVSYVWKDKSAAADLSAHGCGARADGHRPAHDAKPVSSNFGYVSMDCFGEG